MNLLRRSRGRTPAVASRVRRSWRERGQSLVEFAIVLPVFLVIAFGIFDFGMAFDESLTISNAAREGARYGVTDTSTTNIASRVRTTAGRLNDSNLAVTVSCKTAAGAACAGGMAGAVSGTTLVVTVTYSYRMITPIAFGTTIPIASTAQMRVE